MPLSSSLVTMTRVWLRLLLRGLYPLLGKQTPFNNMQGNDSSDFCSYDLRLFGYLAMTKLVDD